jgi:hypothetical protein
MNWQGTIFKNISEFPANEVVHYLGGTIERLNRLEEYQRTAYTFD